MNRKITRFARAGNTGGRGANGLARPADAAAAMADARAASDEHSPASASEPKPHATDESIRRRLTGIAVPVVMGQFRVRSRERDHFK